MNTDNNPVLARPRPERQEEAPVFAARLFPYRSLGPKGFAAVMLVFGVAWFFTGIAFMSMGAWPIFAFMGLDFLILWIAFRLNYRSGRQFEEVAVWPHDLRIRQVSPAGRVREHSFNPFWTRFRVDRHDEIGITKMVLMGQGREVAIGAFLNPADRESFAAAFTAALGQVKGSRSR